MLGVAVRERERDRRRAHPPHEQPAFEIAADDGAAREVRVVVHRPVVAGPSCSGYVSNDAINVGDRLLDERSNTRSPLW